MICTISQPETFVWVGYLHKMIKVDTFVLLDHVQFKNRSFQNRNRIRTSNGVQYLTIPVVNAESREPINEKLISYENSDWIDKHLKTIQFAYKKAPMYNIIFPVIEDLYLKRFKTIAEFNIHWIDNVASIVAPGIKFIKSSELKPDGAKADLILNICKQIGADKYYSGPDGEKYLNLGDFWESDIDVEFQKFTQISYPQIHGDPFEPSLSSVDIFMNMDFPDIRKHVRSLV